MASFLYTSALEDEARGAVDFDSDTFYVMLLTSAYTPNEHTHTRRSDLTNEVTGAGYTAGGQTATVTITKDTVNNRVDVTFGAVSWPSATITARYAAYYKRRGGAATADELIALNDFGANVISTGGTFTLSASTYRKQK